MATASKTQSRPERATGSHRVRRRGSQPQRLDALVGTPDRVSSRSTQPSQLTERERRLEEVMLTTWAALVSGHPVECPVCGGPLTAARGCSGCGSKLS